MFRGFNLLDLSLDNFTVSKVARGRRRAAADRGIVKSTIDAFVQGNGILNGSELQQNWFPTISADVFISHSHNDEELALALAGWLESTFELRPFVDASVWGYADELLKEIDQEYCRHPDSDTTYSYEKRNGSTSHVHMMLSTALGMMIDNTECLIFLNTNQSITSSEAVAKTQSPWLFAEIAMARVVRKLNRRNQQVLTENRKKFAAARSTDRIQRSIWPRRTG